MQLNFSAAAVGATAGAGLAFAAVGAAASFGFWVNMSLGIDGGENRLKLSSILHLPTMFSSLYEKYLTIISLLKSGMIIDDATETLQPD